MSRLRVLVTGSRNLTDYQRVKAVLDKLHVDEGVGCMIHGGAKGADALAGQWAREYGLAELVIAAQWNHYGKKAGPLRNGWLLEFGRPDVTVGFPLPDSVGTFDMLRKSKAAGVRTFTDSETWLVGD